MQLTKGGCIGQTFALAKSNDSSRGKRSKRRSKEERKVMVETFIKRYQVSNNGNFPSLRLTHKEVGGSYYTVREVFRELIQENRVLAPPKLPPGGDENMENLDSFLENNPLGSISFDPNIHPKDNQTLLNEYEFRREKVLNSRKISELHKRSLEDNRIVNGSTHTAIENENVEDPRYDHATLNSEVEEVKIEGTSEGQKDDIKEVEVNQDEIHSLSEDVVVETFPLRPVSSMVYDVDEKTSEKQVFDGDFEYATGNDEAFKNTSYADNKATGIPKLDSSSNESSEASKIKELESQETNPIVSFTKTFIAGFMKFWS